ncbi:MAG: radical SAM protein [Deltaproteobacteria bacterium]|nr:radical SAM protein [Deltaproteobacteria bacterium]
MNLRRRLNSLRAFARHDRLIYGHLGITHRCNMRCRMCTVPERGDVNNEADAARFRTVAKELADLGCLMISIGGGEPFLRKDLPKIVEAFADEGLRVRCLTNGITASKQALTDVANAGATDMSMSLDSLDAKIQAEIEAMDGIFPRKMRTLSWIREIFPPDAVHIINAVVTPQTLPGLRAVAEFARRIGFFSSFIPVHLAEGEHDFFSTDRHLAFTGEQEQTLRAMYAELLARRDDGGVVNSKAYLRNSLQYLLGEPIDWDCHAGELYVSIAPNGRLSICHQFEETDVHEPEGFARWYRDGDWRERARGMSSKCQECYRPCWAEIDHLAFDAEAFWGALKLRFWNPGKRRMRLSVEDIERVAARVRDEFGMSAPPPVDPESLLKPIEEPTPADDADATEVAV